ncbi:MAG: hypothetical protein J4469_01970 [Candidatus Aenigmarchaeota archaeon]|nr:hypothetical protein [Candidatus Aenigmarchaeota archaeon]
MFVAFGDGKCPFCGDASKQLSKETYHCSRCDIAFNKYYVSVLGKQKEPQTKFWT